jgi:hypothetical protein
MGQPFATLTFTPRSRGKVILLVDFNGQVQSGTDWGNTGNYGTHRLFLTQNAVTTNTTVQRMSTGRLKYAVQGIFDVEANLEVDCGLELGGAGLFTVVAFDVTVRAHLVKETST